MTLDEIAKKYGTDKCSTIHNYCNKYEKYLLYNRDDKIKILEIGVSGGSSLKMWSEYFYNSLVIGVDILEKCKQYEEERIKVEIGRQEDPNFLKYLVEKYGNFDLIIDDGSHMQNHMIKSFEVLFDSLKNSGQYILEDTCCSYWDSHGGGYRKNGTSVEYFKDLVDDVNFNGELQDNFNPVMARRDDLLIDKVERKNIDIRTDIESINFINSIIIINKNKKY